MANDSSQNRPHRRFRLRSRAGGVAVMALIIAIVTVIFFQSYLTSIITDQRSGAAMDQYVQVQGERMAIERIVKESVLEYYEGQWVRDDPPSHPRPAHTAVALETIINNYLSAMAGVGGHTYSLAHDPLPPSYGTAKTAFWPNLTLSGSFITTTVLNQGGATGGYSIVPVNLDTLGLSFRRAAASMPVRSAALQVQPTGSNDYFLFTITRDDGHVFRVYVRLFQVPLTDFNLVSYAIANSAAGIPADPPALPAALSSKLAAGTLRGLSMSRMATNNSLNDASGLLFPYSYREVFSGASLLPEYFCYYREFMDNIVPMSFMGAQNMCLYSVGSLSQTGTVNGATPSDTCYIDNFRNASGVIQTTVDPGTGATVKVRSATLWRIDLNNVPATKTTAVSSGSATDSFRRIYVQIRGSTDAELEIKDSVHGGGVTTPVLIWLNGWGVTDNTGAANAIVNLSGDLTDQDVYIYASGVTIRTQNASLKGAVVLDDVNGSLISTSGTFNLQGSLIWKNGIATVSGVDLDHTSLTAGTSDILRSVAPRFLVVDVQSNVQY